ncbi:MAG: ABC transporter permease subunit [Candidatus Neomarinimicrobiota bacterium]
MMLFSLVKNELTKISGKRRSFLGFIVIGVLMPLILWGFKIGGGGIQRDMTRQLQDTFVMVGSMFNGFLATYFVMNFLWVHIPFLITLVAGDVVAGEGAAGTFRIYLTRPVSRSKILLSKLAATYLYTAALIVFFAVMSLGLGSLWLGAGDLIIFHRGILILPEGTAWLRFGLSFVFAIGVMCVVASLCFMFSTMVNNGIGPMIGAMAVIVVGLAVSNIPLDLFETIRPYLFTSYFDLWKKAFYDPIPWADIAKSISALALYTFGFIGVSFAVFTRKEILS